MKAFEQDSKVQFVIDAVYAFAHALDALKRDHCPTSYGVCQAMTTYDGGDFYKNYLLKVDFIGKAAAAAFFSFILIRPASDVHMIYGFCALFH